MIVFIMAEAILFMIVRTSVDPHATSTQRVM